MIVDIKIYDWGELVTLSPPPPPLKKVKYFAYGTILLKFKTEHFHMFANNNWEYNLYMG